MPDEVNASVNIGDLKKRRGIVKGACKRIKNFVDAVREITPDTISQIEERKIKLDEQWCEYNNIQIQLELLDDAETSDRITFEDNFYYISGKIRNIVKGQPSTAQVTAASPIPSNSSNIRQSLLNVRLPKLDLPKFSGRYDEWFPFHDAFDAIIHKNEALNDIHKLQYLRAATTDDANKLISSLEISEANYELAWKLLKERYDNKRMIVQNHLKSIMELPVMHKENASDLRQIADGVSRHVQALKTLKRPADTWDDILVYLLVSKLDSTTSREWQKTQTSDELPTLKQFLDFLNHHCHVLETTSNSAKDSLKSSDSRSKLNTKQKTLCNAAFKTKCEVCRGEHPIYQCKQFLALSVPQRIERIRALKVCLNCLRSTTHISSKCMSGACKICSRKHNTLLHIQASSEQNKAVDNSKKEPTSLESAVSIPSNTVVTHSLSTTDRQGVLLSTAVVLAQRKLGSLKSCRVLLDSGSQANFITREFLNSLELNPRSIDISISGVNGTLSHSNQAVRLKLFSRINSFPMDIDCIVTDQITENLPAFTLKRSHFDIPRNIQLADPKFNVSSKIDILIGSEAFWNLLCIGQIPASDKHPLLQKTRLGWILAGRLNVSPTTTQKLSSFHASITNAELSNQLNKFWQLDTIEFNSNNYTLEEKLCEQHFLDTVSRNSEGRYIVKLPIKEELIQDLGNSRDIALKRLKGLERRFDRDSKLKEQYSEFIDEYIKLDHMKAVSTESEMENNAYYLPHHCILKTDAKSTKFRVVFDGSCKSDTGLSLNDIMMTGPVVQNDLVSILLRFRTFKYVLVADIVKMYRQVLLHPSQTKLQRILWRNYSLSDPQTFELATVTYGTAAASYLATRCLVDLADRYASEFLIGASHVKSDFYVDDLLTGANSKSEVIVIRDQIVHLLNFGRFKLSKWGSNCHELLDNIDDQGAKLISFDKDDQFRILGILWDRDCDTFRFSYNHFQSPDAVTKRVILSEVSRLFDPLGLLGPIVVIAKIILQSLWQSGIDWDESVPQDTHTKWLHFKSQLTNLDHLQIPRCVKCYTNPDFVQIHGFCDASTQAYGACIYIRTQVGPREYQSHLLYSKSRVAPIKTTSLPRLELASALLLAQSFAKTKSSFDLTNVDIFLWSDSTIALNWITSTSRKWSVFVANRVGEIQRLTDLSSWRHVSSSNNAADGLSRGMLPDDLIKSDIWWHGPSYLKQPQEEWPTAEFNILKDDMPEQRINCNSLSVNYTIVNDLLNKFSNLNKIGRILAYCTRFFKARSFKYSTLKITPQEISNSLNILCKTVQKQSFPCECIALSSKNEISNSSNLKSLSPFMDNDELIRVGGRLKNSAFKFDACHQIVLPKHHMLTKRIIEFEHVRNMHSGVQATMAAVRQRFWPLSLRSATRNVINNCIRCFKAKPVFSEALMGSLPAPRVTPSRPFAYCGVDYAGPITIREGKRRNSRNHKAYIAIFVCFATKAVHIEVVSDLTTESFIAALKRLISRRGKPIQIYSDNATNFVGAQRQIKEFYDFINTKEVLGDIELFLHEQQTSWIFIPPNAPNFGGLWEAAVKSTKFHLTRIVGTAHLTFEELQTILCEIEAILNSRPLLSLSSDANDMTYLSPGHFLVGAPLNSFPTPNLNDVNTNRLLRWKLIEQMRQHFWSRWSTEYLSSLQERHKWNKCKGRQLEPGQLVVIKQQGLAPLQWLMGRIEQVHLGSDNIARSATVKTIKGSFVRPISRLALLPI